MLDFEPLEAMNETTITALWRPWTDPGLEHVRITNAEEAAVADGMIIRALDSESFRATYRITCDPDWKFRSVELHLGTDHDTSVSPRSRLKLCLNVTRVLREAKLKAPSSTRGCFATSLRCYRSITTYS